MRKLLKPIAITFCWISCLHTVLSKLLDRLSCRLWLYAILDPDKELYRAAEKAGSLRLCQDKALQLLLEITAQTNYATATDTLFDAISKLMSSNTSDGITMSMVYELNKLADETMNGDLHEWDDLLSDQILGVIATICSMLGSTPVVNIETVNQLKAA